MVSVGRNIVIVPFVVLDWVVPAQALGFYIHAISQLQFLIKTVIAQNVGVLCLLLAIAEAVARARQSYTIAMALIQP